MNQSPSQTMFVAALQHHKAGRLDEAEQLYRKILQSDPHHADTLHLLGVAALQRRKYDAAADLIAKAIAQNDKVPAFHVNLGNALREQGKLDEAANSYRTTLRLKPDHVDAHYNLGLVLQAQEKPEEAAVSYRQALKLMPNHVQALLCLGNVLLADGKPDEAMTSYRRALVLKPDFAEVHNNVGSLFRMQGQLEDAAASYRRALSIKPDFAEAHGNLGLVHLESERLDDAAAACRKALSCKPDYAEAYNTLGMILVEQGRQQEAQAAFEKALAIRPDFADAMLGSTVASIPVYAEDVAQSTGAAGAFANALGTLEEWSRSHPGKLGKAVGSCQPFYLAYRPTDATALLTRYGSLVSASAEEFWQRPPAVRPRRDRIRLAIVSGQVRRHHPVWEVILRGIVANLDRERFEVCFYHTAAAVGDEAAWAAAQVDRFVPGPKPVGAWLEEIKQDAPDVIFYPEIGMDRTTSTLAALRLAPLQAASWGHPVTTGLPSINLYLSGDLIEGPHADRHYRERLVRLPGTGVCMDVSLNPTKPWASPDAGDDVVRFALCHQPIKFDPADDALLARIAKAAGPSEFWLLAPRKKLHWVADKLRDRLAAAFRAEGLDPDAHLRVMPWFAPDEFNGFLDEMDVYLDCPAFSGYTTAWHALHRGLPIVTLEGDFMRQRLAAGLLRQIGITDGIASSRDQYVEHAIHMAQERRRAAQWSARRDAIRIAAAKADSNREAVEALQEALIDALRARTK
jgi:protein O-GlcNAc transferase